MDPPTQAISSNHDEITPWPAVPSLASSTGPATPSRPSTGNRTNDRPQPQLRPSSIRIRRLPSTPFIPQIRVEETDHDGDGDDAKDEQVGRRRSSSAPQAMHLGTASRLQPARVNSLVSNMPSVMEETAQPCTVSAQRSNLAAITSRGLRRVTTSARSALGPHGVDNASLTNQGREYESGVVDLLDVVDPEVSTLHTLTNVQNSLFVPDLGRFLNRQPTYTLTPHPTHIAEPGSLKRDADAISRKGTSRNMQDQETGEAHAGAWRKPTRSHSISSALSDTRYAVLPHNVSLDGWSEEDIAQLNDYVRHMLHSRRSKFKRGLKGFGKYVRKPLGFCVTLYAVLITLFGLAWVLFLIGWIYVGERQPYIINVIDNVLVALFALNGDVLAPFRAYDTYHMIYIAHYHHLTWRLRREKALPSLRDENDLPVRLSNDPDVESAVVDKHEISVLNAKQQEKLIYHQNKFSKSHSFYKPHETVTHTAFPLRLLVAVVVLLDCHSCFQIALGACTWGIHYKVRPEALTAVILTLSITCNIAAGITISVGDRMTRKKEVIKRLSRQALTEEAMRKVNPELAENALKDKKEVDPDQPIEKTAASPEPDHYSTVLGYEKTKTEHDNPKQT